MPVRLQKSDFTGISYVNKVFELWNALLLVNNDQK